MPAVSPELSFTNVLSRVHTEFHHIAFPEERACLYWPICVTKSLSLRSLTTKDLHNLCQPCELEIFEFSRENKDLINEVENLRFGDFFEEPEGDDRGCTVTSSDLPELDITPEGVIRPGDRDLSETTSYVEISNFNRLGFSASGWISRLGPYVPPAQKGRPTVNALPGLPTAISRVTRDLSVGAAIISMDPVCDLMQDFEGIARDHQTVYSSIDLD